MKVHLTVAALAVCVGCAAGSGGGEPPGDFRRAPSGASTAREDRVILTEFNNITGVAVSRRMVFVTSPQGLGIFDRTFERWMPPITGTTGYSSAQVTAIAADPVEDGVWIATPGSLTYYRAFLDFATSMTVPGIIDVIIFDRRDPNSGAYVRSAGTWLLASRTGSVAQVSQEMLPPPGARDVPSTLRSVYAEFPQLETFAGLLTRDNDLQAWPVSAAAKTPDVSEVWLGTRGNGVYKVDPLFNVAHHFPYGLLADGAGALAPAADGIWIAGSAGPSRTTYGRGGLTFASMDLQRFRWLEGPLRRPLAGARANDLVVRMSSAWIATDRGVARMDTRNEDDFSLWNLTNGLPADQALALAVTSGGAWVGTSRGLVFIADSVGRRAASARAGRGVVSRSMIEGTPVRALLLTGDTLWIGTDAGLMLVQSPSPDSQPRRVAAPSSESRLMRPIRALARSDSVVMVLTQSELVQLNLRSGGVMTRYAALDLGPLRSITAAAVDSTTIWITGLGGLLVISRASGVSRFLTAPGEIPGEAYDVELDPFYAWIATREGVLRLRRLNDGTVR